MPNGLFILSFLFHFSGDDFEGVALQMGCVAHKYCTSSKGLLFWLTMLTLGIHCMDYINFLA